MTMYKTGGIADAGPAIIIGLLIGLIAAQLVGTSPKPADAQQSAQECPAGSYLIGYKDEKNIQPVCKLEPTGCPYGDSIPMDMCDKFKPVEQPTEQVQPEKPKPAPEQAASCGGK